MTGRARCAANGILVARQTLFAHVQLGFVQFFGGVFVGHCCGHWLRRAEEFHERLVVDEQVIGAGAEAQLLEGVVVGGQTGDKRVVGQGVDVVGEAATGDRSVAHLRTGVI